MLLEDDSASRTALRFLLAHAGWEVLGVSLVAEALRLVRQKTKPDAVILDLMLPDGDGLQVLEAIRQEKIAMRVAIMTGVHDPAWLERAEALHPDAILSKPIDMTLLLQVLAAPMQPES